MGLDSIVEKLSEIYNLEIISIETIINVYLASNDESIEEESASEFQWNFENNKKMLKDKIVSGEAVNIMDLMKVVLYRKGKNFEVIFNDQIEEKNLIDLTFEKKNPKKI